MKYFLQLILILATTNSFSLLKQEYPVKTVDGKKYYVYTVKKGDDWHSIAKEFDVKYLELRIANKKNKDKLPVGGKILVPATKLKSNDPFYQKNYIDKSKETTRENASAKYKYHTVTASQTLYRISKIYNVTVDELKEWNGLRSNEISVGQKLIVGKKDQKESPSNAKSNEAKTSSGKGAENKKETVPVENTPKNEIRKDITHIRVSVPSDESDADPSGACVPGSSSVPVPPPEFKEEPEPVAATEKPKETKGDNVVFSNGRREVNEDGMAISDENDAGGEKYYAYHQTAPYGTIIKVVNAANQNKVYVKVIGKIPSGKEYEGAAIVISKSGADRLGATQKKFPVNLQFGVNN